jgi:recombination protein RecT
MTTAAQPGVAERASTAVARREQPQAPSLVQLIDAQRSGVERALPAHLKEHAGAYTQALITVVKQTPGLLKVDPLTVLGGLMTASSLGLEFGPLGHAYLVPFKGKAQFILGYKGKIDLAWRSGKLRSITARTVRENDEFDFDYGLLDSLHHKPVRENRGQSIAWYGMAKFQGGGHHFVVLFKEDVERHRKASASANSDISPWKSNYDEMAMKSAIHEMTPYLPLTTEVLRQMATDGIVASGTSVDDLQTEQPDYIDVEPVADESGEIQ